MTAAEFDEVSGIWTVRTDRGVTYRARFLVTGLGLLSATNTARPARHRALRGPPRAYRRLARGPGPDRQAGRCHRQRLDRQPGDHRHRADRRAPDVVPAHAAVQRARRQPRADPGADCRPTATTSTPPGTRCATPASPWASRRAAIETFSVSAGGARTHLPGGLGRGRRLPVHVRDVLRHRHRRGGQRGGGEVHPPQDRRDREGPRDRAQADPAPTSTPAARCATPATTRRSTAPNVTLVNVKENPIVRGHARRASSPTDGTLHELDVLVFATGFDAVDGNYVRDRHPRPPRAEHQGALGRRADAATSAWPPAASPTCS